MTPREYKHVSELDESTAATLLQFILSFADTKHFLGRRISEWVTAAPAMEASVAAANITQEELGHARSLLAMVREIPGAPAEINTDADMSRNEFYAPAYLGKSWQSWIEVIAAFFLLDSALTTVIAAAKTSSLLPLRQRVAKILQEEHFHQVYYRGWLNRLASISPTGIAQLTKALQQVWPVANAWLGPDDDASLQPLFAAGIFSGQKKQLKGKWQREIDVVLSTHGIADVRQKIDWPQWNAQRREVQS